MPNEINRILQQLKHHPLLSPKYCDSCGSEHKEADLSLVSSQGGNFVFQLACQSCGLMQILKLNPGGPMAIQRFESNNSDIHGKEFQKFAGKPSLAKEEVLDVYQDMKQVENLEDFLQMVAKREDTPINLKA